MSQRWKKRAAMHRQASKRAAKIRVWKEFGPQIVRDLVRNPVTISFEALPGTCSVNIEVHGDAVTFSTGEPVLHSKKTYKNE